MSDGISHARAEARAFDACEDAADALRNLFDKTAAFDRAFGVNSAILRELNTALRPYRIKLVRIDAGKQEAGK